MYGCTEQKYWYAPGVVKVNENLSPVSSAFDLKSFVLEATVCGTSSSLIQVTVVPAFTATRCGMKACWSIFTKFVLKEFPVLGEGSVQAAHVAAAARTRSFCERYFLPFLSAVYAETS